MNEFYFSLTSNREERAYLRQAGFNERQIDGLRQLRRDYEPTEQDQVVLEPDQAHLLFLRWLIQNRRLTR